MKGRKQRLIVLNEIEKWAKHGRGLYEYQEGDILLFDDGITEVLRGDEEQMERLLNNIHSIAGVYLPDGYIGTPPIMELFSEE